MERAALEAFIREAIDRSELAAAVRALGTAAHKVPFPFAAGWANFAGVYEDATYSKIGRLVVVQGLVTKTGGTPAANDVIGTLPAGFRPTEQLMFGQNTGAAAGGQWIDVFPTGEIKWIAGGAVVSDFTTLSGISYVVD